MFQTADALKELPLGCILAYVEDLNRGPKAGIGPKDLFVISFYSFCCSLRYTTGFLAMIDLEAAMPTVTVSNTVRPTMVNDMGKKGR